MKRIVLPCIFSALVVGCNDGPSPVTAGAPDSSAGRLDGKQALLRHLEQIRYLEKASLPKASARSGAGWVGFLLGDYCSYTTAEIFMDWDDEYAYGTNDQLRFYELYQLRDGQQYQVPSQPHDGDVFKPETKFQAHGLPGVSTEKIWPDYGLDPRLKFCVDHSSYLPSAKHDYAVLSLSQDDPSTEWRGCPENSRRFFIRLPIEYASTSQYYSQGDISPNHFAGSGKSAYAELHFCFVEGKFIENSPTVWLWRDGGTFTGIEHGRNTYTENGEIPSLLSLPSIPWQGYESDFKGQADLHHGESLLGPRGTYFPQTLSNYWTEEKKNWAMNVVLYGGGFRHFEFNVTWNGY